MYRERERERERDIGDAGRDIPWAVTFIPMPVPETDCRTNLQGNIAHSRKLVELSRAGVWV